MQFLTHSLVQHRPCCSTRETNLTRTPVRRTPNTMSYKTSFICTNPLVHVHARDGILIINITTYTADHGWGIFSVWYVNLILWRWIFSYILWNSKHAFYSKRELCGLFRIYRLWYFKSRLHCQSWVLANVGWVQLYILARITSPSGGDDPTIVPMRQITYFLLLLLWFFREC